MKGKMTIEVLDDGVCMTVDLENISRVDKLMLCHAVMRGLNMDTLDTHVLIAALKSGALDEASTEVCVDTGAIERFRNMEDHHEG